MTAETYIKAGLHTYGSGSPQSPAIVFLHGSPLSGRMWLPQLELLPEFHCLAPDLPEHGLSAAVAPFEMADVVRRLVSLIQESSSNGRAHVVGLSFGGVVAQALMVHTPEVVDHVVLSGTAARLGRVLLALLRFQVNANRPLYRWLSFKQLAALVRWQFGIPAHYEAGFEEDLAKVPPDAMIRFILATYAEIETPSQARSPVLVAVGQKETPVAKMMARRLTETIRGAKGVIIPAWGHVWNLQAPQLFADVVRAWVLDKPLPAELRAP
jgi:pimeloyl-ACP methyl ester carboxylesterase